MRQCLFLLVSIFLMLFGIGEARENYVHDEILVKFVDGESARVKTLNANFGCIVLAKIPQIKVVTLRIPHSSRVPGMISAYVQEPEVEYAEPNYFVHALSVTPNDPYYGTQWHLPKIKADEAWVETKGSSEVRIAVVDTGIDLDHPDIDAQVISGYDFVNGDNEPDDDEGHGTHMAGIIAAETNNGEGVAGINWYAGLMPVKVLDEEGAGTHADVALGLIYAADNGARVINLSFGGEDPSQTMEDAINYAYSKGCILVAGAGNEGGGVLYPARYPNCIAVGATDEGDNWCGESIWGAGFSSSYGAEIDVVAPGNNIVSTYPGGGFAVGSGASMATACVSGMAALTVSVNPNLSNVQVRDVIRSTCDDLMEAGWDEYTGYGRINVLEAIQKVKIPRGRLSRSAFSGHWSPWWRFSVQKVECGMEQENQR